MKEITVQELKTLRDEGKAHQLIDVREAHEVAVCSINGEHIPMATVMENSDKIKRDIPVVVHCRGGKRSAAVIDALERTHQYDNLMNLKGGILAWAKEIDPTLPQY